MIKKVFFLFLAFANTLHAYVTFYDEMQELKHFELQYYFDANRTQTIESIDALKFSKKTSNFFTFGYTDGNTWFKLKIQNKSQSKRFIFQLQEPYFQRINFFIKKNGTWEQQQAGLTLYKEDKNKKNLSPTFSFNIEVNQSKTIYLQFAPKAGKATTCFGRFSLNSQTKFNYSSLFNEYLFYAFFFGTLFIIIVFNLFLYSQFHETIYLYYAFYLLFLSIYIAIYSGLLLHMGLASWHKEFSMSIPLFIIFLVAFSDIFLKLKHYLPRIHKLLKYILISMLISLPYLIYDYDTWMSTIGVSTVFIAPIVALSAFYVVFKGHKEAKYYIPGIILYIASLTILPLMSKGLIEHTTFTHYVFTTFSFIEVMFFSFVLVQRFFRTQNEKIYLQSKLLDIQKNNEKILERKVEQRTNKVNQLLKEKEVLLKEVYHRVKNNFQMVVSLIWIENESQNDGDSKNSLLELINRIKSMALIHQYLLGMDDYAEITAKQYIAQINQEIEKSYSEKLLKIDAKINTFILSADQALALGIIINELLTNAVKHHGSNETCIIEMSCIKQNNDVTLSIQDNGQGFDMKSKRNSFGLKLIKQFTKKLRASKSEFTFERGTKYELVFEL
jgi:two-component sensor histidine kinase